MTKIIKKRMFICKCKDCGKLFKATSNTTRICPDCKEYKICCHCGGLTEVMYDKKDSHIHICNKCAKELFVDKKHAINVCKNCGKEFFHISNRKKFCEETTPEERQNSFSQMIELALELA